jgi:hypothetical protein
MEVVEAIVLEDKSPQSLTIELPDGRLWKEMFFTSKEKILNVLEEVKQEKTVQVTLNEKSHIEGDIRPAIEGIILPKGITPSKKVRLFKKVS